MLLASAILHAQSWEACGTPNLTGATAEYPLLATDPAGVAHLVFSDGRHGGRASLYRLQGNTWIPAGPAGFSSAAAVQRSDVAFTADGQPFVIVTTDEDDSGEYALEVYTLTNGKWTDVSPPVDRGTGIDPKIGFANGFVYIAFMEPSTNGWGLSVMRYSAGGWSYVGEAGFGPAFSYPAGFTFRNGQPCVAFPDSEHDYRGSVMTFNGTEWVYLGDPGFTSPSADAVLWLNLELSTSGTPYVAFTDKATLGINTMRFVGGRWERVGGVNFAKGFWTDLAFDGDDAYLAFQDLNALDGASVMRFRGSGWEYVGAGPNLTGRPAYAQSLTISHDLAQLAFTDPDNRRGATVMKFSLNPPSDEDDDSDDDEEGNGEDDDDDNGDEDEGNGNGDDDDDDDDDEQDDDDDEDEQDTDDFPTYDRDGDGVRNGADNCPDTANPAQADSDCDSVGDDCDVCPGIDDRVDHNRDGIPDCTQVLAYDDYIDDWKCGKPKQEKITVLHIPSGDLTKAKEKCISVSALRAHLGHGDVIGATGTCD
ncbi:thrombospondin type 3 repeat-containing protein [Lewinella sp. JB7]|uniref:thrombospondin type 3 repeat-containing protein n=1 Tax=Lewinella sp. JB7 TaxID=2962887 RepID=UPI0020C9467E|nr:hypothetical protein [Lewinella sp. JB7]